MVTTAVQHQYRTGPRPGIWVGRATTGSVVLLAVIAAVVSFGHMHQLALAHGEGKGASALIPLSVDGMIVAASMSLLLDSRLGRRGGLLPWALLITGAAASLAANIAVAEPTMAGRVIAAWPSFALTASYELLMRQVRHTADAAARPVPEAEPDPLREARPAAAPGPPAESGQASPIRATALGAAAGGTERRVVQRRAWQWALANRRPDGSLPAGSQVARQFGRSERWGRLVTGLGREGQLTPATETMTAP